MNNYSSTSCLVLFFIFSLFHHFPRASSKQGIGWCDTLFQCGNITAGFPFWGGKRLKPCGHPLLELQCNQNITSLTISNQDYYVFYINQTSYTLRLARPDLLGPFCSAKFITTTFLSPIFELPRTYKRLTVYNSCDTRLHYLSSFTCPDKGLVSLSQNPDYQYSCQNSFTVNVPTSFVPKEKKLNLTDLEVVLRKGFDLKVVIDGRNCQECVSSGGICGFNNIKQVCCNVTLASGVQCRTIYYSPWSIYEHCRASFSCGDQDNLQYPFWIPGREECGHPDFKLNCSKGFPELNIASGKFRILNMSVDSGIIRLVRSDYISNICPLDPLNVPFNGRVLPLAPDTKLLTLYYDCPDFSSDFLYSGYIGELGCINHEKSYYVTKNISTTLHDRFSGSLKNLKGLCKRNVSIPASGPALITLQRVPTLDNLKKAIEQGFELALDRDCLACKKVWGACGYSQISSGFICYCQNGSQGYTCDSEILKRNHDFGLAKLCEKKESILSLLDTRGTVGYIAPEMISRVYGSVSHKSDVYSYGMLVLEMIGARNKEKVDQEVGSNSSSMYFPDWVYKDLETRNYGRVTGNEISSEEEEIAKKMTLVGLWCIQSSPSDRPPMNRVVEMMEGKGDPLVVPPKPVLQQIPTSSLPDSSWNSEESSRSSSNSEVYLRSTN